LWQRERQPEACRDRIAAIGQNLEAEVMSLDQLTIVLGQLGRDGDAFGYLVERALTTRSTSAQLGSALHESPPPCPG
jgi:hypothetical protein